MGLPFGHPLLFNRRLKKSKNSDVILISYARGRCFFDACPPYRYLRLVEAFVDCFEDAVPGFIAIEPFNGIKEAGRNSLAGLVAGSVAGKKEGIVTDRKTPMVGVKDGQWPENTS